jgi:hypothetical protein
VTAHCAQQRLTVTERCRPPLKVRSSGHLWDRTAPVVELRHARDRFENPGRASW